MTHNTREGIEDWKEEFWYKVAEWNSASPEDIDIYANQIEMLIEYHMKERVHQELQKARQDWLREEIVKLEGMDAHEPNRGIYRNEALQTIIDRYQSELDQPNK